MTDRISIAEYRQTLERTRKPLKALKGRLTPKLKLPAVDRSQRTIHEALRSLMFVRDLHPRITLKPEEKLSVDFATFLRAATLGGRLHAVWTHPANEIAGKRSRTAELRYAIAKAIGMIDGTADYLFLSGRISAALEAKVGHGKQQDNQSDFELWCRSNGVPYFIFRTVREGEAILTQLGIIDPVVDLESTTSC